jgi:hypothetical protein
VAACVFVCFLFSVVVLLLVFSCLLFLLLFLAVFGFRPLGPWFVSWAYFVLLVHFSAYQ